MYTFVPDLMYVVGYLMLMSDPDSHTMTSYLTYTVRKFNTHMLECECKHTAVRYKPLPSIQYLLNLLQ